MGGESFGSTVYLQGDKVLVGAPGAEVNGCQNAGRVYEYDLVLNKFTRDIANPAPAADERFGSRGVSMTGSRIYAATPYDDTGSGAFGSVQFFSRRNGKLLKTVSSPSPAAKNAFGSSLFRMGKKLYVGEFCADSGAYQDCGAVHFINALTGKIQRTIVNPDAGAGGPATDYFGISLTRAKKYLAVGANFGDVSGVAAGRVYIFHARTGAHVQTLLNPSPHFNDEFGWSCTFTESFLGDMPWLVIGAPYMQEGGEVKGAVCLCRMMPE